MNPVATITETTTSSFDALRERIDGVLVTPEDPGYAEARAAWNLAIDQRPVAVALPRTAEDVVAVVDFAREHGHRIAAQGTGHGAGSMDALEGTILVRTSEMNAVEIHAEERWARVEAGALWIDVAGPAAEHGLAAMAGSSHDVGVTGYTLGGGMGCSARKHGLSAHNVRAIEIVTADGRHVRTDHENEPDLFWALRGGGGNFGVVTALEVELHEMPELYAGAMFFDPERAVEVITAYTEWARTAPDEVSASARVMFFPDIPDIPEPMRGQTFTVIDGAVIGDEAFGNEVLAPFRSLEPIMDTFEATSDPTVLSFLHMDPPAPTPANGDGTMVGDLSPEAVERFVEAGQVGPGSPLLFIELRQLGGRVARPEPGHGAVGTIDAAYILFAVGIAPDAETFAAIGERADAVMDALAPWQTGRRYLNLVERPADAAKGYEPDAYTRLTRIRADYDPDGLFQANHVVAIAD